MSLDRGRILHINVTEHPTAEWAAQQLVEAFPGDGWIPRFLQRDRDGIYGWAFRRKVTAMGIEELISAAHSPWQNCYVERVIGSIRRECTDHVIPMGEKRLLRALREAPIARRVERTGQVVATSVLGGLHHRYSRAA